MKADMLHLLKSRRFLPLFLTQFLGAANDNLFKSALVLLITFDLAQKAGLDGPIVVTVAAGLFIAPFFLFSATAGQMADRFDKSRLAQAVKAIEIVIMIGAALAFVSGNVYALMSVLFCMGSQSALFGPVKYSILPQHLQPNELISANALIGAGTFLAILGGTIAGGLLILTDNGIVLVSSLVITLAVLGFLTSLFIPKAPATDSGLHVNLNIIKETATMLRHAASRREVFLSILGISWFWLIGATFLSQFPAFAKVNLGGDENLVTLFLAVFSVGIGIGSLICSKLLKGEVTAKYVPFAALIMTFFMVDLFYASNSATFGPSTDLVRFLSNITGARILADLLMIAITGGLFIVPLYAILQSRGDEAHRARDIAANNIMNALFMVLSAIIVVLMLAKGLSIPDVFLSVAILNAGVAIYICKLLPDELVKSLLRGVFKLAFRVDVQGLEHWQNVGHKAVIVVNHVSFLDGALLAAFLPQKPLFAINTQIAEKWWMSPFLSLVDVFPMDPTKPLSLKSLITEVSNDRKCVIFPEGRITVTGGLMKVYEGPAMIADKSDADILPVRIDGAEFTYFSRLKGTVRQRLFPKITLTILPPRRLTINAEFKGAKRRSQAGLELYDLMSSLIFESRQQRQSLFHALLDAAHIHGSRSLVLEDIKRAPLSYDKIILKAITLGRALEKQTCKGACVGVLLPNSVAGAVTFMALQATGRVPAMLNFSAGPGNMTSAIQTTKASVVVTSKAFVEAAKLEPVMQALHKHADIIFLEDIQSNMSLCHKVRSALICKFWSLRWHKGYGIDSRDAAVVMFTSGSEGTPKGVVLSHDNVLANRYQLSARIDFNPTDIVFNALPIFHSFGLCSGLLLPLLSGVQTFLYPSPLHYRIVPELVYDSKATVMFGTDTFLAGYARVANAYDFFKIRYVCAGAEKIRNETRQTFADKFGLRILEGYGTTETAPVLSFNTPMHFKAGTVGRFLPGIDHKLEPIEGIEDGGLLYVRGPNVMKGYYLSQQPAKLIPPLDGWYDTGDIVSIDAHGFISIKGRAKRFAKIAGEMVSLGLVEELAGLAWPEQRHAAMVMADPKKGEQVFLISETIGATRDELLEIARAKGIADIMVPKKIIYLQTLPVLGSGKTDYPSVENLVRQLSPA